MLCKAFREGKNIEMRKGTEIVEAITVHSFSDGYKTASWLHQGLIAELYIELPDKSKCHKILVVYSDRGILSIDRGKTARMNRYRKNYILKHCFNTPVTYHLKYSEFNGYPRYGYFRVGSKTYEADSIKICFDENYNVVDIKVDENKRVIYAMNDGKVKYLVKLAKQLREKIYEINSMLKEDYPEYLRAKSELSCMFRVIDDTGLLENKLYAKYSRETIKDILIASLKDADEILKDVKRFYAEKTLFPK